MATAMGIGQGAGTAAALAVRDGITSREVDVSEVRGLLLEQGQYLLDVELPSSKDEGLRLERVLSSGVQASHHNPFAKNS